MKKVGTDIRKVVVLCGMLFEKVVSDIYTGQFQCLSCHDI